MSPWARIDDGFHSHPKVEQTSLAGRGLFVTLVSYAANHLTDGMVPESVVKYHARGRGGRVALDELLRGGLLFRAADAGAYGIHDYLDYNDSRAEVEAQRRQNRERQDRHRSKGRQTQIAWDGAGEAPRNAVTNAAHSIPPTHTTQKDPPKPPASGGPALDVWHRMEEPMRAEVTDTTFATWVEPIEATAFDGATLTLRAPEHLAGWVRERFRPLFVKVASKVEGRAVEVVVAESDDERASRLDRDAARKRKTDRAEKRLGLNPEGATP